MFNLQGKLTQPPTSPAALCMRQSPGSAYTSRVSTVGSRAFPFASQCLTKHSH